jgi:hypothetical protein
MTFDEWATNLPDTTATKKLLEYMRQKGFDNPDLFYHCEWDEIREAYYAGWHEATNS